MGHDPEPEEAESAPPPPGANKVEITVAGHSIVVESGDPLSDVVGYALGLFEQTAAGAQRIPLGFATGIAQVERAEAYREPSGLEGWEDDDARRVDRNQRHAKTLRVTRRLGVPDSPGGDRARLRPLPVDPGQCPLRCARH